MNWHRVRTMLLFSWFHFRHSVETWVDLFWFSLVSLIAFGFMTRYLGGFGTGELGFILAGYILWEVVRIGQYAISVGVMWNVWSNSFSTLFVSPLKFKELFTALMGVAVIHSTVVAFVASVLAWLMFDFWLYELGMMLFVYYLLLIVFAWGMGLFIVGLILRFGTRIQSLAWGLIFLFQPISALYYPVSALPASVQWISYLSPVTYVMENVRFQLSGAPVQWSLIGQGAVVSLIYFMLCVSYIVHSIRWAKKTGGFARLES